MSELKWLDYSGQSTGELISLEGKYRTDSLVVAIDQALNQKSARIGEGSLTTEERIVLAIEALEAEVNNGGCDQFFFNSSGAYAPIIVQALRSIGREDVAALTDEAVGALEIRGPLTADAVDAAMQLENVYRDNKLSDCTSRYFQIAGDLAPALFAFIKANSGKIDRDDRK
ncbi:MAG: DUF4375 domain-containing protein [Planctomycetes bacterium]|nr:DUF4375 domain-containing protein [Planctomycetota bacterium]MBI3834288.1 DUF4375 domain-containing protein [Planctomycetota bacterium]